VMTVILVLRIFAFIQDIVKIGGAQNRFMLHVMIIIPAPKINVILIGDVIVMKMILFVQEVGAMTFVFLEKENVLEVERQ